jgi:hypothetical protein
VGGLVILAIYPACRATVLGMTALKQMDFSLAFAIAAVAAAQIRHVDFERPAMNALSAPTAVHTSTVVKGAIRRRPGP